MAPPEEQSAILRELEHVRDDIRELRQVTGEVREGVATAVQHAYDHDLDLANLQRVTRTHTEEIQEIKHDLATARGTVRVIKWIGGVIGAVLMIVISILLGRLFGVK